MSMETVFFMPLTSFCCQFGTKNQDINKKTTTTSTLVYRTLSHNAKDHSTLYILGAVVGAQSYETFLRLENPSHGSGVIHENVPASILSEHFRASGMAGLD